MRILISGYCPHGKSGYGLQTKFLFDILTKKGYDVGFVFWDMKENDDRSTMAYKDFSKRLFSKDIQEQGSVYIPQRPLSHPENYYWDDMHWAVKDFNPTHIITIHDIWTIEPIVKPFDVPMYGWIPIHYDPPEMQTIVNLRNYETIWSLSLWGKGILEKYHHDVIYIPHVIDDIYFDGIFSNSNRRSEIRKQIGISEHSYVILMVARNTEKSNRKGFDFALQAFAYYKKFKNPLAHLHMHVNIKGSIDIQEMAKLLDIGSFVTCSDQTTLSEYGFSSTYLRNLYLMSDVLLSTSAAEGFGLPIVEAQCCGLPVIATNCTAMSENVALGRISDPVGPMTGNPGSFSKPNVDNVVKDIIYLERNPPSQMEKNGIRAFMSYKFNGNTISEQVLNAIGKTHDVKMFFLPHTLDAHETNVPLITWDGNTGFNENNQFTTMDDETQTYRKDLPLKYSVYGVCKCNDYEYRLITITEDGVEKRKLIMLFEETDDSDTIVMKEETVCDANESWMLGEYNDVPVYANRSYPIITLTEIESNDVHHITLPMLEFKVREMCMYKHFVYLTTIDTFSWIYDIHKRTLQKIEIISPMTTTNCVIVKDDELRIYGVRDEKPVVKIIRYKDLKIVPGSL
jgi:glycosyltransferase involved in cell wall biosynthesis/uncharacterized membrane protein